MIIMIIMTITSFIFVEKKSIIELHIIHILDVFIFLIQIYKKLKLYYLNGGY
jgi:hypothetical protein